jgi:hypothetical protein
VASCHSTVRSILAERAQLVKSCEEPPVVGIKTALLRCGAARGSVMLPLDTAARDTTWKTCGAGSISRCDLACQSERLRPLSQRLLYLLALHPRPRVRVDGRHAEAAIGGWLVAQDQLSDERVDSAGL